MVVYLITGIGGTGKSAVAHALIEQGFYAKDTDTIPGLARWEDVHTHKPVELEDISFVDYTKVSWNWNKKSLRENLHTDSTLFLCGSASNQSDFYNLFTKVFVLDVTPENQAHRLAIRRSKYGKSPAMITRLIQDQAELLQSSLAQGAIKIDNNSVLNKTIDEILSHVNND